MRILSAYLLAICCFAAGPAGTLTTSASFRLDNTDVPVAGVPHWPVWAGQSITIGEAPALMELSGGSRLWILPKTRLSLAHSGAHVLVKVSQGGLAYKLPEGAMVEVASASGKRVPRESREGRLQAGSTEAWAPSEAALYAANPAGPRAVNTFPAFSVGPFSTDFMDQWRLHSPPFGNPPDHTPPPDGGVPPGLIHRPPGVPPVSLFRP